MVTVVYKSESWTTSLGHQDGLKPGEMVTVVYTISLNHGPPRWATKMVRNQEKWSQLCTSLNHGPPRWPSGSGVHLERGRCGVQFLLAPGFYRGQVIPVTLELALQWLSCQAPGVIGSVLRLAGLVLVYFNWAR